MADRLVQGQVTRAQEAEDSYALRRELASMKQKELLTEQELERAYRKIEELTEVRTINCFTFLFTSLSFHKCQLKLFSSRIGML